MQNNKSGRYHWVSLAAMIVLAAISFCAWVAYNPEERMKAKEYRQYREGLKKMEEAQKADIYGGKTPEETKELFLNSLKSGNLELASKYFELNKDPSSADYMTRHEVERALLAAREKGELPTIVEALKSMKPAEHKTASPDTVDYVTLDKDGFAVYTMTFSLNRQSGLWKIQSL